MSKKVLFRERSMSSVPSKLFSVTTFINEKESTSKNNLVRQSQKKRLMEQQDQAIQKLKRNLQSAVTTAVQERIISSRINRQYIFANQTKIVQNNKIKVLEEEIVQMKQKVMQLQRQKLNIDGQMDKLNSFNSDLNKKIQNKNKQIQQLKKKNKDINLLQKKLQNIYNIEQRIKTLQYQLREEKLKVKQFTSKNNILEQEKKQLINSLIRVKPQKQQLKQKIAYLQRVNLDLQRKMEDYHRKQNELLKQKHFLKTNLVKTTNQRNNFKQNFENTSKELDNKVNKCNILETNIQDQNKQIQRIQDLLQKQKDRSNDLEIELKSTIQFYKNQNQQNIYLRKRTQTLELHNLQQRQSIQNNIKVAQQVNLYLIEKNSQLQKLRLLKVQLQLKLQQQMKKFEKFNYLFEEGTLKGENSIRQSVYLHIRALAKFQLEVKELKQEATQRTLKFNEEKKLLLRKLSQLSIPLPTQQTFYQVLLRQKSHEIVLLKTSNDELIKLKIDLQCRQKEMQQNLQKEKKQVYILKLKYAQLFKVKKQLQQALKIITNSELMISQQKKKIQTLESEKQLLKEKLTMQQQKNQQLDLLNTNLQIKLKQYQSLMEQFNIQKLKQKKAKYQKNANMLKDSLQKAQAGVKTLEYYFTCSICHQFPENPITVASCGHNFCQNCKQEYTEQCGECDNGSIVEKAFVNRYLRQCINKYKFLYMLVAELNRNFDRSM